MRLLFCLFMLLTPWLAQAGDPVAELFAAASQGRVSQIQSALAQGVDVDARTTTGRTALMGAAFFGNELSVRLLLSYGADANAADNRGITPLMDAVAGGWTEVVKLLLAAGADIKAKDKAGQSVLDKAKQTGNQEILKLLTAAGVQTPQPSQNQVQAEGSPADSQDKGKGGQTIEEGNDQPP